MPLTQDEMDKLDEMLPTINEMKGLRSNEQSFVDDITAKYEEQGADMFISPRMWQWLQDIAERA